TVVAGTGVFCRRVDTRRGTAVVGWTSGGAQLSSGSVAGGSSARAGVAYTSPISPAEAATSAVPPNPRERRALRMSSSVCWSNGEPGREQADLDERR
ncbi:hypothetical protein, partial [Streptomyces tibetensis]|uniref:hypothetical protein n=1 Tax=Streptomyces tibetensis TaxID=2382123 RepID=UPI0033DF7F59